MSGYVEALKIELETYEAAGLKDRAKEVQAEIDKHTAATKRAAAPKADTPKDRRAAPGPEHTA
jgi:hypothetical protein